MKYAGLPDGATLIDEPQPETADSPVIEQPEPQPAKSAMPETAPYAGLPEGAQIVPSPGNAAYESETERAARERYEKPETAAVTSAPVSDGSENVPEWGRKYPNLYGVAGAARETLGPILEALGSAGGAALATGAALPTGPGAAAAGLAGAGLGYSGAHNLLKSIDVALGNTKDKGIVNTALEVPAEVATGAAMEAGGQVAGKAIGKGIELAGKGIKQVLGASTGAGPGMVEEAFKSGTRGGTSEFTSAMRGKTTGNEIVDNVRGALQTLKDSRATAYRGQLEQIAGNTDSIDISPVRNKLVRLLQDYGVKSKGPLSLKKGVNDLDFSRSSIGKSAQNDIDEIVSLVREWGTKKGDRTPAMLDTLKRRLDDFYSDSSQARQFVTALRNEVKDTIVREVPEYAKMTKGYTEATRLIKDIEAGLMLRKQGMTGRVTEDATLRRLTSALRENFELRKDLVDVLGSKSGQDLAGQIAGYSAEQIIPRGLVGKMTAGSVGMLAYINPKFWPVLAASSPRAVGEFVNAYGKVYGHVNNLAPAAYKTLGFEGGKLLEQAGINVPDLISSAEAADYTGDLGGTLSARNRALQEAAGDGSGIVGATVSRASGQEGESSRPLMSMSARERFDAETKRMQAEQEARKRGSAPAKKAYIPVTQVTVQTPDGEELMWKDKKGKLYGYDPNE